MKRNPDFWGCGAEGNDSNTCVVKKLLEWGGGALYEAEGREIYIFGVLRLREGKPIYFCGVGAGGRETQFWGVSN